MQNLINTGILNIHSTNEILMPLITNGENIHLEYCVPQLYTWIATEHLHIYKIYSYFLI